MVFKDLVCVDYETIEILPDESRTASTEAYRKNFRVSSMATTERSEDGSFLSLFYEGEEACRTALVRLQGRPLLAFNAQFEMLVSMCRFAELNLNWAVDAQRLAQNYDNGGKDHDYAYIPLDPDLPDDDPDQQLKAVSLSGFSLSACIQRILQVPDHKQEAYKWLVSNNVCKKGDEGRT
jgi:hypothetical protein